jgi:hypothetical protein
MKLLCSVLLAPGATLSTNDSSGGAQRFYRVALIN